MKLDHRLCILATWSCLQDPEHKEASNLTYQQENKSSTETNISMLSQKHLA